MQTVKLERPDGFARTMIDMRTWLDSHGIQPISFRTFRSKRGGFTVELRFSGRDQASRFAEAFAEIPELRE